MTDGSTNLDIDLTKVAEMGNTLLEKISELREQSPVFWSEKMQMWLVTGHEQVAEAYRGNLPLSCSRNEHLYTIIPEAEARQRIPYTVDILSRKLNSLDGPEHMRLRRLMMKAFSRQVAESYREEARRVIAEVLEEAAGKDQVEFVGEVALRSPGQMILKLMGLSDEHYPKLREWSIAIMNGLGGGGATPEILDVTEAALLEMRDLFMKELDARRNNPKGDFISSLLTAEEDGQRLTDQDILATCYLTLIAGYDTTANTITLGAVQMAKDPQLWETMRTMPQEEVEKAVMEMMRHMAMFTASQRVVKEDFIWAGQQMKAGDMMWVMAAGANRDPKVFPDPEKIDFNRNQTPNMTFAPGMHFCIGHFLAKMQLTEYYPMMAKKFVGIESLDETLHWGPTLGFRGLATWNVRFCEAAIARGMNASQ